MGLMHGSSLTARKRRLDLAPFKPRLLTDLASGYSRARFFTDLGAGLTVAIVALPLAMAFAIASGVKPESGLFTAIIAGFLISALGGSSVQIGGPAGAFIVIVYGIVQQHGLANLLISTVLAGGLLFLLGLFRLGVLVRYLPVSIVIGFTNGIAVLIALSQLKDLLGLHPERMPADFFGQIQTLASHLHQFSPHALALGLTTLIGLLAWPRLFGPASVLPGTAKRMWVPRMLAHLPAPVVMLVGLSVLAALLGWPVATIGTRFGGIPQGMPSLQWPEFSWEGIRHLFIPTITIAMLGAIESLLCARVADNMSDLPRHDPNQELMAQGVANMITPFFGGIPATGTIARTVTNVKAGASSPVAGMVHALSLLLIVLVAAPLAVHVPLPVLAGILLLVAWNMGEWREFAKLRQFHFTYRSILLGTFLLTVIFDLTVAVEVGLAMACVFFIYRMSTLFRVEALNVQVQAVGGEPVPARVQVFGLHGSLFFGAVGKVEDIDQMLRPDTEVVLLSLRHLMSMDTSGLDALVQLRRHCERQSRTLVLCELGEQPLSLIRRSHQDEAFGPANLHPTLGAALERARVVLRRASV